jgi:hypothetical protein
MSTKRPNGPMLRAESSAIVGAAAPDVYRMIADYRNGHPRIIPSRYFRDLQVDEGGYGQGTVIRYDLLAFGTTRRARARVTEPEPGRIIVETDLDIGAVTTFVVEPVGSAQSRVTIATDLPTHAGPLGWVERAVIRPLLVRAFVAELAQLDAELKADAAKRAA